MVKITPVSVSGLEIEDGDLGDRVTVYFRDIAPRAAGIMVIYGCRAWHAWWAPVVGCGVREYVARMSVDYLEAHLGTGIAGLADVVIQATRESLANESKGVA